MPGGDFHTSTGVLPMKQDPGYKAYKSPYGPKYKVVRNFHGITMKSAMGLGLTLGGFGAVAGVFAVFFFAEVPKFRKDVMIKIPFIGQHFIKEVPASDNPF